MHHHYLM